ncbi:MAG TPA: DNA polymerase IV [Nitrososphaeraceae archaeon]|nr:DNA polymerase IV [Nitrososphaeraceae archaeon]
MKYYIGCSVWNNQTWVKDFYPATLEPENYLEYYSNIYDFAEVDLSSGSVYSKFLNKFIFRKWTKNSHDNFRFTLKVPGEINNNDNGIGLGNFLEKLAPLEEKILAVVIEQPRELTLKDGREWLEEILDICNYHGYSAALEFNHFSWFQDLTYNILKKHNAALIWSDNRYPYHPVVTADFLYLRITENEKKWIEKIKEKGREEADDLDSVIVVVDAPTKANTVLNVLNLPVGKYGYNQWIGKVIMCVDLNAFFPSCEELRDPTIVGKPHAVIMTEQKENITKGAVASCSYEARNFGVNSAMSLSKAKELCPTLVLRPVDISYYRQVSEKVMNILEEYADVLEQSSIDEAYLDCTNKMMRRIMTTESATATATTIEQYASTIKKAIKERIGLLTSVGIASTKSAAKIASDFQKPDGLTIIYPDQLQKFFEHLEVERISGIGPKTQQILKEMGAETIGQLAKHDVQKLIEKFGKKNGIWMWRVANGRDDEPVMPREDHISLSTEQTLDSFTGNKETILKYLNQLVDEIYERIRRQGYEFKTVGVKLVRSDFSIETRETSFSNFQNKRESIASVIEGLLDRFSVVDSTTTTTTITRTLPTVRKVGIKVSNLVRIEKKKPLTQKTLLDYFDSI